MPCTDGGAPYPPSREEILDEMVPTAALCAFIQALPVPALQKLLERIDWKEAGITRDELMEWWRNHQRRDAERKAAAAELNERDRIRKKARSKLTKEELTILGVPNDDTEF